MVLSKNDFVEMEFTGRVKDGEVFDSNIKENLEKLHSGHDHKIEAKPFVFSLGKGMFLDAVDAFLIGKEPGKYEVELTPDQAFGKREPSLIQRIPVKLFHEHKINPIPGALFNFDQRIGKVLTASGGRVVVDFNNPLSGKTVIYDLNVKRKVTDLNERVKAVNDFLFRDQFDFTIKGKKLVMNVDKSKKAMVEMFKDKFKELLGLDLEVLEKPEKKQVETKNETRSKV